MTTNGKLSHLTRPQRDRLLFDVLRAIKGENNAKAAAGAVSPTTIRNWRLPVASGGTRFPQAWTMDRVLRMRGKKLGVVDL